MLRYHLAVSSTTIRRLSSRRRPFPCPDNEARGIVRRQRRQVDLSNALHRLGPEDRAWTSNRLKRLVLSPKRYVVDPGLAGAVLGLDVDLVLRNGDLLGRLLDTFVASQLRAELASAASHPRLYHVRQQQGRFEVDLLAELGGGRLVGIEIKADAAPTGDSARRLAALRDRYPDAFVAGIVLHTGPRAYRLGDRLLAAPISTLWS